MNYIIELLGIVLVLTSESPTALVLPDMKGHVPGHTAFIAFEPDQGAIVEHWGKRRTFVAKTDGKLWQWVPLQGESLRIVNGTGAMPGRPPGAASLQKCCPGITKKKNPELAAHIELPAGTFACARDHERIDSMLSVSTAGPLVITTTDANKKTRKLTFPKPTRIIIGNFPIEYITGKKHPSGGHDDFLEFYKRLFDNSASCHATPSDKPRCDPNVDAPCTATPFITLPLTHGAQIDCGNSTYP